MSPSHGARCSVCGKPEAHVVDSEWVPRHLSERVVLAIAAVVGVRVEVHHVRLVECTGCVPGRVTRHRELVVPLEAEFGKRWLRSGR